MAINELTTGIGTLAGIAWTPLDGTGLSAAQRTSVDKDVKAASAMATALLDVTKSAFNRGWSRFSLNDLADAAGLGSFAYLARTNLRLSTTDSTDDTPGDWATFIGRALGNAPATDQARSLGQWRRLAADLQQYAALQASKFDAGRDPSLGSAGGVTHAHGQWYANGQALSLLDLFTAARVNQVANHEDALDDYMFQLQANSRRLTAAREWLAMIRIPSSTTYNAGTPYRRDDTVAYNGSIYKVYQFDGDLHYRDPPVVGPRYVVGAVPTDTRYWQDLGKKQISSSERNTFHAKWGYYPDEFHKTAVKFDQQIEAQLPDLYANDVRAYIDSKDADNQALQQKIQQKSNRRDEVLEAMVSFAGKQSKTGANMAGNLA